MNGGESLLITTRQGSDRVVFELEGELDLLSAPALERALVEGTADGGGRALVEGTADGGGGVVIDLRKVTFIDSTGLRTIFSARNQARERGQAFAVTPGTQQVQRLLSITRLGEHLRTIGTPDEALA